MKNTLKFLSITAALLFLFSDTYAQQKRVFEIVCRNSGTSIMWDGTPLPLWGFKYGLGGQVEIPAPFLYVNEGDSVIINVINQSPMPHTIHMHGVDVNQANDGVPETSFLIPGILGEGTYRFLAEHAGTYIYHCHYESVIHTTMGMYGAFIVRAKDSAQTAWTGGPSFDKEYTWVISEMDKDWHEETPENGEIPWFEPEYFVINGKSGPQLADTSISISADPSQKVYLRTINIGYGVQEIIFPASFNARTLSSDGRPLPVEQVSDTLRIYPGERYGTLLDFFSNDTDSIVVNYYDMYHETPLYTNRVPLNADGGDTGIPNIQFGQVDSFENESSNPAFWAVGAVSPVPPVKVASGGPSGEGDSYMKMASVGGTADKVEPGSRLVVFNGRHWTGNYIEEGVKLITMDAKNLGDTPITLRMKFDAQDHTFISQEGVTLSPGTGWQSLSFSLEEEDLKGIGTYEEAFQDIINVWIYHSDNEVFPGPKSVALLGIDNITATHPDSVVTSINRELAETYQLSVFPNPVVDELQVSFQVPQTAPYTIKLIDLTGREVYSKSYERLTKGPFWMDVPVKKLAGGVYYISLLHRLKPVGSDKIFITK
ncbi:MAG: multicopper oxidase domain-containing protein [Bacteroidota bacterium]